MLRCLVCLQRSSLNGWKEIPQRGSRQIGHHTVATLGTKSYKATAPKSPGSDVGRSRFDQRCLSAKTDSTPKVEADIPTVAVGQVMSAEANFVRVRVLNVEGNIAPPKNSLLCVVRSVLKKMKCLVLVGDRVRVVGVDWTDGRGMVEDVLPRDSELMDPRVANIDHVVVLMSIADPPFEEFQATRFVLSAASTNLPVTLVLNKVDLVPEQDVTLRIAQIRGWGYQPVMLSVVTGKGLEETADSLKGRISAVIGPSGVGKSSLINALRLSSKRENVFSDHANGSENHNGQLANEQNLHTPESNLDLGVELQAVQDVSSIGRGKHTTRTISFLELPNGGLLADTPGFSLPDLSGITVQTLPKYFPEIQTRLKERGRCRFNNCYHLSEPGCVINDGEWERHALYANLHQDILARETYERDTLGLRKQRREGNTKVKIGKGGVKKSEVKLEAKKHRRVSRRARNQELKDELLMNDGWDDDDEDDDWE